MRGSRCSSSEAVLYGGEGSRDGALELRDRHLRVLHSVAAKLALGGGEKMLPVCSSLQGEPELPLVERPRTLHVDGSPRERVVDHARAYGKQCLARMVCRRIPKQRELPSRAPKQSSQSSRAACARRAHHSVKSSEPDCSSPFYLPTYLGRI